MHKCLPLCLALASWVSSSAMAEDKAKDDIDALREQGYSVRVISPIFGQLVAFSLPKGFKTVFEKNEANNTLYIREAVLDGETVDQWSQMITVTGAKKLAANPFLSPQSFLERIATDFKRACPGTYFGNTIGARKIDGQDAFVVVASCGTVQSGATKHGQTALIIAIKGSADYYTIQWAERGPASGRPMALDDAKWTDRFEKLNPIKLCPLMPDEAPPYPSCIDKK